MSHFIVLMLSINILWHKLENLRWIDTEFTEYWDVCSIVNLFIEMSDCIVLLFWFNKSFLNNGDQQRYYFVKQTGGESTSHVNLFIKKYSSIVNLY